MKESTLVSYRPFTRSKLSTPWASLASFGFSRLMDPPVPAKIRFGPIFGKVDPAEDEINNVVG
jgi:hypothetical protein